MRGLHIALLIASVINNFPLISGLVSFKDRCRPLNVLSTQIDAIVKISGGPETSGRGVERFRDQVYAFSGEYVSRVTSFDSDGLPLVDEGFPKFIQQVFPRLESHLDAAFQLHGQAHFLKVTIISMNHQTMVLSPARET